MFLLYLKYEIVFKIQKSHDNNKKNPPPLPKHLRLSCQYARFARHPVMSFMKKTNKQTEKQIYSRLTGCAYFSCLFSVPQSAVVLQPFLDSYELDTSVEYRPVVL